ncbi:MAG: biopolymer transporter ExbD [Gammaproteobacteria bacterium]|nr:biopolymer transporter ExbD [Gammaproteobacteria bacterium]
MAGSVKGDNEPYDEINITPMLDLSYVLLIIFIIMTTAAVQGINVNLPKASKTPSIGESRTKAITITAEGQLYLDTYPVSMQELESRLSSLRAADPQLPVVVKGDHTVQYQLVIDVLDMLARIDITKVGLVTQKLVR